MERIPEATLAAILKGDRIVNLMFAELERADKKYEDDKMSPEEMESSYYTIKCELNELKREIVRKKKRPEQMQKEAVQVMAMAFKFIRDVCMAEEKNIS